MRGIIIQKNTTELPYVSILKKEQSIDFSFYNFSFITQATPLFLGDLFIIDVTTDTDFLYDVSAVISLRKLTTAPIILISAEGVSSSYRETMLNAGVDICVQSPFLVEELVIKVRNLLHKNRTPLFLGTTVTHQDVSVDVRDHTVKKRGEVIHLTKTEISLLEYLIIKRNNPVSAEELVHCLPSKKEAELKSLYVHLSHLRRKLGGKDFIQSIPHYGFIIK